MTDIYKLLFLISCIGPAKPRIWELAQYFDSFDDMYDVLMSSNAGAYLTVPGVNGLLVGGSSLILSEFIDIIETAKRVRA